MVGKRAGFRFALIGNCWCGSWKRLTRSGCILCHCFGKCIWLSLVGPALEAEAKIREAGSSALLD